MTDENGNEIISHTDYIVWPAPAIGDWIGPVLLVALAFFVIKGR